ncbi:MAG: hypothetical protein V4543_17315 [Bacteroidota bacterium]
MLVKEYRTPKSRLIAPAIIFLVYLISIILYIMQPDFSGMTGVKKFNNFFGSYGLILAIMLSVNQIRNRVQIFEDRIFVRMGFQKKEIMLNEISGFYIDKVFLSSEIVIKRFDTATKKFAINANLVSRKDFLEIQDWLGERYPDLKGSAYKDPGR